MTDEVSAKRIRITGKVQGVGFRMWTSKQAQRLGLRGWVRNAPDGSVTALFEGPAAIVSQMEMLLRQGPAGAAVDAVVPEAVEPENLRGFRIVG